MDYKDRKEYYKKRYKEKKEFILAQQDKYREENRDMILEKKKKYYKENKDIWDEHRSNNRESIRVINKKYRDSFVDEFGINEKTIGIRWSKTELRNNKELLETLQTIKKIENYGK